MNRTLLSLAATHARLWLASIVAAILARIRPALACLLFTGCAHTTIYEDGKPIMKTQADATNITLRTSRTYFHADKLDHSTPTLAQGEAAAKKLGAAEGIIIGVVGKSLVP
jgi:hypothetical protein